MRRNKNRKIMLTKEYPIGMDLFYTSGMYSDIETLNRVYARFELATVDVIRNAPTVEVRVYCKKIDSRACITAKELGFKER